MTDKTYNWWSNYQTWIAGLWLDEEHVEPLTRRCIVAWLDEIAAEASSLPRGILRDLCLDALERIDLNEIISRKGIDQ